MERNRYGINFDSGFPLESSEDFELLYVDLNALQRQRLVRWINNESEESIIVAGQIGTGKTTFITKALDESPNKPDIRIALDTEVPFYSRGAYWGLFLGKILEYAGEKGIDLSHFHLSEDLISVDCADGCIGKLVEALLKKPEKRADFKQKEELFYSLENNLEIIRKQLQDIIARIQDRTRRTLFVFAEGVDKFKVNKPDYESLLELLNFLSPYKTLYEANLVHLLGRFQQWQQHKKIIIAASEPSRVLEILRKRLGVYVRTNEDILPVLARLSGGNLRQGLKLLMEYHFASDQGGMNTKEALDYTCQRVRDDFLNTFSDGLNPQILKVVQKDHYIGTGTLTGFDSRETAQEAVYRNWILIKDEVDDEQKWPAVVNPLLLPAIEAFKDVPESPETRLLKDWAISHELSPFGLEIDTTSMNKDKIFDILNQSEYSFKTLTITDIFNRMAVYFLDPEKNEKIIAAYENRELVKLANDFIIGRAGTYKPGRYKEIVVNGSQTESLVEYLIGEMENNDCNGYSIFFNRRLSDDELTALDQKRDTLIGFNMIWWIEFEHLKDYLKFWPQLRQFFKIFHLEEDVLANISIEEIEEDLDDLEYIDFTAESREDVKSRLQHVLHYLESRKNG